MSLALVAACSVAIPFGASASLLAPQGGKAPTSAFIVKNPIDLEHVIQISKFRSCMGHDFSPGSVGPGMPPNKSLEWGRSMKHYIGVGLPDTPAHVVKGYAPFNGTVVYNPGKTTSGIGVGVASADGKWMLMFAHVDPLLPEGTRVKAGRAIMAWPPMDLAAYNDIKFGPGNHPDTGVFDLSLESKDAKGNRVLESPLIHMVPSVAKAWAAKGFTPKNAILSRAYRDARPCELGPDYFGFVNLPTADDLVYATGYHP